MTYLPYIIAAYAVFAVVLVWDVLTPYLKQHRLLRSIRLRAAREQAPFRQGPLNTQRDRTTP